MADMEKGNKNRVDCGGDEEKLVGRKVRIEKWATYVVLAEVQIFGWYFREPSI